MSYAGTINKLAATVQPTDGLPRAETGLPYSNGPLSK
jgi:hypothetical protein